MNVYIWKEKLPSAYQEVEYIQNSGTQYIKTSLNICTGYREVLKVRFLNTLPSTSYPGLAGGYIGYSGSTYYRLYVNGLNSNGTFNYGFMGSFGDVGSGYTTGRDYTIDFSWISGNMYLKVDGTSLVSSTTTYSTSLAGKACLFGAYSEGSNPQYRANPGIRLYYSKFYNSNGDLVGDFVPCYRKSDNVIGMYDLVNNQFYTNSGSGIFSKGNDVTMAELKNAYIGEVWTPGANTLLYYKLESNINDYSGNGRNGTIRTGSLSYGTSGGTKQSAFFNRNTIFSIPNIAGTYSTYTFNVWCKPTGTDFWQEIFDNVWTNNTNNVYLNFNGSTSTQEQGSSGRKNFAFQYRPGGGSSSYATPRGTADLSINTWYNVCVIGNSSGVKLYLNGTKIGEVSTTGTIILNNHTNGQGGTHIGGRYDNNGQYKNYFNGYISEFIFESKTWDVQEISHYYDITKANYGL